MCGFSIQAANLKADPIERRRLNQAFSEYLEIDNEEIAHQELAAPFAQVAPIGTARARTPDHPRKVEGSYAQNLMDLTGQLSNLSVPLRELLAVG